MSVKVSLLLVVDQLDELFVRHRQRYSCAALPSFWASGAQRPGVGDRHAACRPVRALSVSRGSSSSRTTARLTTSPRRMPPHWPKLCERRRRRLILSMRPTRKRGSGSTNACSGTPSVPTCCRCCNSRSTSCSRRANAAIWRPAYLCCLSRAWRSRRRGRKGGGNGVLRLGATEKARPTAVTAGAGGACRRRTKRRTCGLRHPFQCRLPSAYDEASAQAGAGLIDARILLLRR